MAAALTTVAALTLGCRADWPSAAGATDDATVSMRATSGGDGVRARRELVVHLDGIHSGIRLPAADLPFDLQLPAPSADDADADEWRALLARRSAVVEVGFSDQEWFLHQDRSAAKVARLLFLPDQGAIAVTNVRAQVSDAPKDGDPTVAASRVASSREWRFAIDEERYRRLLAELRAWIDPAGDGFLALLDGARAECYSARFDYALRSNCHDWTAHMLGVAGIALPDRLHRTASRLERDIDSVLRSR